MKHNYAGWMCALALAALLYSGCATSSVSMQVLLPADITVPNEVDHIALINRYYPEKEERFLNVLEGAITGENIGQDRRAAEAALAGLTNALAGSPRFTITRPPRELQGTGRGDFPPPLPMAVVTDVCATSNADALVTIEAFDSDTRLAVTREERTRKTREGNTEKYYVFVARKEIDVTVGWRMYNGTTGAVMDEYRQFRTVGFAGEGATEPLAIANIPGRDYVVQEVGRVTGADYSARISPTWIWVSRSYFKKGNDALKASKNSVRANDWERARQWWEKALDDPKPKVQGRAMHNLALATEMEGNLEEAHRIAKEAASKYGNRRARDYMYVLQQRIYDQQRLDQQMEGAGQ